MEFKQQNFKTSLALQKKLALKREALGHVEFYKRVESILSPTIKQNSPDKEIMFGRRFEDDIFWSIQIRYPEVTMGNIRKIADDIC